MQNRVSREKKLFYAPLLLAILCVLSAAPAWAASPNQVLESKKDQMPEMVPTSPAMTVANRNAVMETIQSNPAAADLPDGPGADDSKP